MREPMNDWQKESSACAKETTENAEIVALEAWMQREWGHVDRDTLGYRTAVEVWLASAANRRANVAQGAEAVAWESTTTVYRRFITDTRYQMLRPEARKWYKPYRCPHCASAQSEGWRKDAIRRAALEEAIQIIEMHRVPVGNSPAGEMAAEWTMDALHEIRDAIRELTGGADHAN